jgi:hypothetical protein
VTQNNGTLTMTNTVVSSAGSLTLNGIAVMNGVESTGVIRVNPGAILANSNAVFVLGPGSRTTVEAGGTLAAGGG